MEDTTSRQGQPDAASERIVYVMPQEAYVARPGAEISLLELWNILWRAKWVIVAITAVFVAAAIPYALLQPNWYQAEVLLAPAQQNSQEQLSSQLSGLANLAGVRVGGGDTTAEPLAILRSRDFARNFIEEEHLLPILYPDAWNASKKTWNGAPPDMRDAVKFFRTSVLSVNQGNDTGLVTLSVEWKDPKLAAMWANQLVDRLNAHLRQRALAQAQANIDYLQTQLGSTSLVTLQQSIGRLLEGEFQKLMLARGNKEFAFRVIDHARPPKQRIRPNHTLIVLAAAMFGGMLSVLIVFGVHAFRASRKRADSTQS